MTLQESINKCIDEAEKAFKISLGDVKVSLVNFDRPLVGARALYEKGRYTIQISKRLLMHHPDLVKREVVPHEVAHLVCMENPALGMEHDFGWKLVCQRLGGSGLKTLKIT